MNLHARSWQLVMPALLAAWACNRGGEPVGSGSNQGNRGASAGGSGGSSRTCVALGTGGIASTGGFGQTGGSPNTGEAHDARAAITMDAASVGGAVDGGTETAGRDGGVPAASVVPTSLTIEPSSNNVLSCLVSWKTEEAADSVVRFGTSTLQWEISDPALVTDHHVLVIGMRAAQIYRIKAISSNHSGTASAEGELTTGSLPATIPVAQVTVYDAAKVHPGWMLMNVQKGDGTATCRSRDPVQAVMYDTEGQPVWYYIHGTAPDRWGMTMVELTDKGVLLGGVMNDARVPVLSPKEIDLAGNTLWECPNPGCNGTGSLSHHVGKLSNGHYVILRDVAVGLDVAPVFEELTADNEVVWSWDWRTFGPRPANAMGDWCHGNSITINLEKNEVYANCRYMGLIKTTYQNPSFLWHLPASYHAKGGGDMTFSPSASQYSDTHAPEVHEDGTVLVFDNGGYSGVMGEEGNPHGYHSRVLEYRIDEATKTATLVWEFPGSFDVDPWFKTDFYLPFWGEAARLANGNVLITAGVRGPNSQSRIFEVAKADGKVVWELRLPQDYGVYRSERITPPRVRAIAP
jgi:hypothetical protein